MNTYLIRRRSAWKDASELERAAGRSARVGDHEMSDRVRWIRTYVVEESDGTLGSVCVYQATDPESAAEHARRSGMPCDEVIPVGNTVVIREDPKPLARA